MVFVKEDMLKFYKRIYSSDILTTKYTNVNQQTALHSKRELFLLSLQNNDFLNQPSHFNKFRSLPIKYLEEIIENPYESSKAKYYYTVIKAIIADAKRYELIKTSSNAINLELLYGALKAINVKSFNKKQFKKDLHQIKDSNYFSHINKDYIRIKTNNELLFNSKNKRHNLYTDRILKKSEIFSEKVFLKESVYFIKSKPLVKNELNSDISVISDDYVAKRLNITNARVKQITKNFLKVYQMCLVDERHHNYRTMVDEKFSMSVNIQGKKYGIFSNGSKLISNMFFKSYILDKKDNTIKLNRLANSSSKKGEHKFNKLETVNKNDKINLNSLGNINKINYVLNKSDETIDKVIPNELSTSNIVKFNIIQNNFKEAIKAIIKITHLVEFSNHLKENYKIDISYNINKHSFKEIMNKLTGWYLNLSDRVNMKTIHHYNILKNNIFKKMPYNDIINTTLQGRSIYNTVKRLGLLNK